MRRMIIFMCSLFLVMVSCSPAPTSDVAVINDRPQWESFIALIKLQTPPLLTSAKINAAGRRVIDTAHKDEILAEQEEMIAALKELSTDISVIFRYRFVLNGLSIIAPVHLREQIDAMAGVAYLIREGIFQRPELLPASTDGGPENNFAKMNPVKFIEAEKVHNTLTVLNADGVEIPVRGEGIRVGIIDTGIDYLHKMFGGSGIVADYKNNDPTIIEENSFPTRKVIAGIDLVGADYNASSTDFSRHVPRGDPDPLDKGVHGTHVAGTVAGVGDGVKTYSGVAPDAALVAIKAFGRGSTGESVVIKALDYAIDPNGDYNLDDQVHVTSLSLGSDFGNPYSLYQEAISTAVKGGTLVVVAAGNSGAKEYAIGNPATADDAISVAASIDGSGHNWQRPAIKLSAANDLDILVEAVIGHTGKPISEVGRLIVPLYHIGLADTDLSEEQKTQLRGKVALIDLGLVTLDEKITQAAEAGAVAVVLVNNYDMLPSRIRSKKRYQIPIVMVTKKVGVTIKKHLAKEVVQVTFDSSLSLFIRKELIDTLARFSSYGPRGYDSAIKPEIAAPGTRITSAYAGKGDRGIKFSGTSMATPHISGVVALMRQYRPTLDPTYIKGMLLSEAKTLVRPSGERYKVFQQGGGRVKAYDAVTAEVIFQPAALSLGRTTVAHKKKIAGNFTVVNLTERDMNLTVHSKIDPHLTLALPAQIELKSKAKTRVDFTLTIAAEELTAFYTNLDGYIALHAGDEMVAKMPLLLGVKKLARVSPTSATIFANSEEESYRAVIDVKLENRGASTGGVLLFDLLGLDTRAEQVRSDPLRGYNTCDLQSAGYRIVPKQVSAKEIAVLQFAAKLFYPLTTWHTCKIVVQFDGDGDGIADQELVGSEVFRGKVSSVLYDAHKLRARRAYYEKKPTSRPSYSSAVISFLPVSSYNHSTLLVVSADLAKVSKDPNGDLRIKMAAVRADMGASVLADSGWQTITDAGNGTPILNTDDFLDSHVSSWQTVSPTLDGMGFWQIPEHISVPRGGTTKVSLLKGGDPAARLIAYFPHNASTFSHLRRDYQSKVIDLSYLQP